MRHVVPGKSSIAWFKLAEFVSRGEKERALGLHRLLLHSFDDYAVGCQLAGDILMAFNETEAIEKYKEAGDLYKKNGRIREAIGIYEQLTLLCPQNKEFLSQLFEFYLSTDNTRKAAHTIHRLISLLLDANDHEGVIEQIRAHTVAIDTQCRSELIGLLRTVHQNCDACERIIGGELF
ncbi:MAG: hypothetical protein WCE21_05470 [Candidatus Babeliales bacterium]